MQIENLTTPPEEIYYTADFFKIVESHLNWLRQSPSVRIISPTPQQQNIYIGDLYGLLTDMGVPKKYHWVVLRLNGYHTPTTYAGESVALILPDFTQVDRLKTILATK